MTVRLTNNVNQAAQRRRRAQRRMLTHQADVLAAMDAELTLWPTASDAERAEIMLRTLERLHDLVQALGADT